MGDRCNVDIGEVFCGLIAGLDAACIVVGGDRVVRSGMVEDPVTDTVRKTLKIEGCGGVVTRERVALWVLLCYLSS